MLLRFRVGNYLSIRNEQELSLVASPLRDDDSGLIETAAVNGVRVLPAAILYGANASGKSNVLYAFHYLQTAVQDSHPSVKPGGGTRRKPFVLDPAYADKPTIMEVDFVSDGVAVPLWLRGLNG